MKTQNRILHYLKAYSVHTLKDVKKSGVSYLFVAPFAIIFAAFYIIPVAASMVLSFTYYNILESPRWLGWQNYVNLFFADDIFLKAVKNTVLFAVITGPVSYIAALLFAWFINELKPKLRAFMTLVFYAPSISGQAYIIWSIFFSGDIYGYANGFLMKIGAILEPVLWLKTEAYIMPILVIVVLWTSLGTGFLSFIAGLQNVDRSLYEAGYVDGVRNRWQELWYITLPSMKPQLMFGAVMSITNSFAIHEKLVPLAGFPSINYAAHTVVSHLVDYGTIRFEMGYASAIATFLFIIMIACNKFVQFLLRKVGT